MTNRDAIASVFEHIEQQLDTLGEHLLDALGERDTARRIAVTLEQDAAEAARLIRLSFPDPADMPVGVDSALRLLEARP